MMSSNDYLQHCLKMAKLEPNYARMAAARYADLLEDPAILSEFKKVITPKSSASESKRIGSMVKAERSSSGKS